MIKTMTFVEDIEKLHIDNSIDYIDAIVMWSEMNNVDIEILANYIKKDYMLRSKIQVEAENLNYLKKGNRLQI